MDVSRLKQTLSSIHRRRRATESYEWWDYLNYAQKLSVSSLYKFGGLLFLLRLISAYGVLSLNDHFYCKADCKKDNQSGLVARCLLQAHSPL